MPADTNEKETASRAKTLAASGDFSGALAALKSLRGAAAADYNFALKLSKTAAKLAASDAENSLSLKKIKIALLSSSTTAFLEPLLKYFCLVSGIDADVRSGDFGNWRQDIISPDSWLKAFDPDFAIVCVNYRDAALPAISKDPEACAKKAAEEFSSLWGTLKLRAPRAAIVQNAFDFPLSDSAALLSGTPCGRRGMLERINLELAKKAEAAGVAIADIPELRARCGAARWEDARLWFHAKQHPSADALAMLADEYARIVAAKLFAPKKVFALDLDNTLWGGIIGEDGVGGIELGAPNARGEAFAAFQKYLKELKERGIILAVCSKNNPDDALLPFEKHPSCVLKREDFASFKANWKPKSENIADIARELNLGLDSIVFADDNPAEIREVSSALPQVECLLLPEDASDFVRFVDSQRLFDALSLSDDDLRRAETYRQNAAREEARASFGNMDDFLKSLEMKCAAREICADNIARAVQLLGKTNQFNLTTRRETDAQVRDIAAGSKNYARCFSLSDKFGDNGVVAVALATSGGGEKTLCIDSFVMSCRVIGRGFEGYILADIIDFARKSGAERVRGVYRPTKKNVQTKDFYGKFGFEKISETPEETIWEISAAEFKAPKTFIGAL